MELESLRKEIDIIDDQILQSVLKRRKLAAQVAQCKKELSIPVFTPERENEILKRISTQLKTSDLNSVKLLYEIIMDLNRLHEYEARPKDFEKHTDLGGASVRAVIADTPRALCRYISPLAAAEVAISDIRSQSLPGCKLMVELELIGDINNKSFAAALSVLADSSQKFTLL